VGRGLRNEFTEGQQRVKWKAVAAEIRRHVRTGEFDTTGFLPAERVLAELLHVSRPTVRKAVASLVRAGLLVNCPGVGTRVATNDQPDTSPPEAARIIGLALPDISNRFFIEVTDAVEYTLLQRGYQLLLSNYRHQAALQEIQLRQFRAHQVKGAIVGQDAHWELPRALAMLNEAAIPAVLLFSAGTQPLFDSVTIDERAGVMQALKYLFSLGHQRIAFCRPLAGERPHLRELAYRELMAQAGHAVPDAYVVPFEGMEDPEDSPAFRELFRDNAWRPTAVFAGNDRTALLVLKRLAGMELRVPEDVSVVGFDNLSFTEHLPVPLTTVDQPKDVLGRRAAELLLERVEFRLDAAPRREVYQPRLVVRESCALARN